MEDESIPYLMGGIISHWWTQSIFLKIPDSSITIVSHSNWTGLLHPSSSLPTQGRMQRASEQAATCFGRGHPTPQPHPQPQAADS